MIDLAFDFLLFGNWHAQGSHLLIKKFPIFFFLLFLLYHFGVSQLNEVLGGFHFLFRNFRNE